MTDSSSDEDFDGLNSDEIGVAAHRYNQRLIMQGIGDIIVTDGSENESDEDTPVMDPSGDQVTGMMGSITQKGGYHICFFHVGILALLTF